MRGWCAIQHPSYPQKQEQPSATKGETAVTATVAEALARAKQALSDGQAALTKGDFTAYGKAQDALKQAIGDAVRAESNAAKK